MTLSLAELHKVFPPAEASKTYSHEELLRMYRKLKGENIVPVNNDALMAGYVKTVLRKSGGKKALMWESEAAASGYEKTEDSGVCSEVVTQSKKDMDDLVAKHPELEFYPTENWQHLKALKSYPAIFGMQKPTDNCDKLLQFFRFLASKGIRRYACLQCAANEPVVWSVVKKEHDECVFYNHQIQDYQPFTFENAMSILARIEADTITPIVFHCTAGFGRTGSVMYLILQYMRCRSNRNLLRLPLMKSKSDFSHEEIEKTFLCKEYSFHAAEEFLEAKHENWRLRTKRLNIINQAVANSLQLFHPQETEVAYMQIDDIDDLSKQYLKFAKRLPQQVLENVIELTAEAPKKRPKHGQKKECAANQVRNPITQRCNKIKKGKKSDCVPPKTRNPATNRCKNMKLKKAKAKTLKPCVPPKKRNPATNRCKKM